MQESIQAEALEELILLMINGEQRAEIEHDSAHPCSYATYELEVISKAFDDHHSPLASKWIRALTKHSHWSSEVLW